MPDSSGFGDLHGSASSFPARSRRADQFHGQMYLDDDRRFRRGARSGFPEEYALPKLEVCSDTLTGTLHYAGQLVAMGTMAYKHQTAPGGVGSAGQR